MITRSYVGLEADVKDVTLLAGQTATIQLTLTNGGYVVDAFDLTVRNLDPSWYTLTPPRVSLFPHAKSTITLQLHPPQHAAARAGDYAFEAVATSRDTPTESGSIPLRLWLAAAGELSIGIEPQRIVARRGTFRVVLTNDGNMERPVVLRPTDAGELLNFTFGPASVASLADIAAERREKLAADAAEASGSVAVGRETGQLELSESKLETEWDPPSDEASQGRLSMTLPPGSRVELPLTVQPKKRIWTGGRDVPLAFDVVATPPGVDWEQRDARRAMGELVYRPILAAWAGLPLVLRRALLIGIPLLLLALILFLIAQGDADRRRREAEARAAANAQATAQAAAMLTALAGNNGNGNGGNGGNGNGNGNGGAGNSATQTAQALANATRTAEAAGAVRIVRFDFTSGDDGTAQVTWEVTASTRLTVTLNDDVVEPTGSRPVNTDANQAFTLTGTDALGNKVSQSKGVLLIRPPEVVRFAADPPQTCPGCEITLTWETLRATNVTIDGTLVSPARSGSMKVRPNSNTEYVLVAENALGRTEQVISVTVSEGLPTPTP